MDECKPNSFGKTTRTGPQKGLSPDIELAHLEQGCSNETDDLLAVSDSDHADRNHLLTSSVLTKDSPSKEKVRQAFFQNFSFNLQDTSKLKLLILALVLLQNSFYALIRRYSLGTLKEKYSLSSPLLLMEVGKLFISAYQVAYGGLPSDVPAGTLLQKCIFLIRTSAKMSVPAITYLIMNILGSVSLSKLDAATFSVITQLKVLATALCSVLMLNRSLSLRKWRALLSLTLGVILISSEASPKKGSGVRTVDKEVTDFILGVSAALAEVVLSGFISVYFEKVLKSTTETYSLWDRNFQLAFWSMNIYLPIVIYEDPADPFHDWSLLAFGVAVLGLAGGLLVALSIKYSDSIMKTIATTGAIVLTTSLNAAFLNGPLNLAIVVGAFVVVISVFNYSDEA